MTTILDPVWPWSRLWEALLQVPPVIRGAAGVAVLAALLLPVFIVPGNGKLRRSAFLGACTVLLLALGLIARHTWPAALADGKSLGGSGISGYFMALLVQLGLVLLLVAPPALAGLSVATYAGMPGVRRGRLVVVVALRLLAFLMALIAVARPALAWRDHERSRSQLYIVVDSSTSMTTRDEQNEQSRWDLVKKWLDHKATRAALERLDEDHQTDVRFYRFASEVGEFDRDNPGEADGKRTDMGVMLRDLFERREAKVPLRGLLVLSDGADNGTAVPALGEAVRWRSAPCPINTFACGSPKTNLKHNDVSITAISTAPSPFVPVKGKLTVKVTIDARGFENSKARVRLFLEGEDDKGVVADREMTAKDVKLPLSVGNEVTIACDAPARPGEVKVKVVVETPDKDNFPGNNSIETFVTVSKEGISVLLVDKPRAFEPLFIIDALASDARIRVTPVWVRGGKPAAGATGKVLDTEDQPYDVIVLGDVTAAQVRSIDPEALKKIEKLVSRGSGLMMLGGYSSLGNGDWKGTELEPMLPVDLSVRGQDEKPVQMEPTDDGVRLAPYLLRLDDRPDLKAAWGRLAKLDGRARMDVPKPRRGSETVLATANGEPLLVMQNYARKDPSGKPAGPVARVLAFGGDTTHRWVRNEEGQRFHARFWKQVVVWLAKQEDAAGNVWVKPDVRRLPVRSELGFAVGLRGKGGGPDLRDGTYAVEVQTPAGEKVRVPVVRGSAENRGVFARTQAPGVYKVVVRGQGKDPAGGEVSGEASPRVIVYDEDVEMLRPAADPEFMKKLATAGGGEALRVEELPDFLNRLAEQPVGRESTKLLLRPDWRSTARSGFLVMFFALFCALVSAEWGLRRWWGMV